MSGTGDLPYARGVAVTASDTANFLDKDGAVCDALIVAVAGNVVVVWENGATSTLGAAAGIPLKVRAKRVNSTNTTATGIVALYYV